MNYVLLILFTLMAFQSQAQNEVEFTVQKQKDADVSTYYFRQAVNKNGHWISSVPAGRFCVQKRDGIFHYYTLKDPHDTIGLLGNGYAKKIEAGNKYFDHNHAMVYVNRNDTIWHKRLNADSYNGSYKFCNYTVLEPYIDTTTYTQPLSGVIEVIGVPLIRTVYMIDTNVILRIGDTSYACLKVLESYKGQRRESYRKGAVWKTRDIDYYERTYYYLRKSDYLPVKIETASTTQKLEPYASYTPEAYLLQLVKAFE